MLQLNLAHIYDWPKNAKIFFLISCAALTLLIGYVVDSKKLLLNVQQQQLKNLALQKTISHKFIELKNLSGKNFISQNQSNKQQSFSLQEKLKLISTLAKNNKISLANIQPKNVSNSKNQALTTIHLQANSNFTQLLTFLKQLNQLHWSILTSRLTLKSQNNFYISRMLNLDLTLELTEES